MVDKTVLPTQGFERSNMRECDRGIPASGHGVVSLL